MTFFKETAQRLSVAAQSIFFIYLLTAFLNLGGAECQAAQKDRGPNVRKAVADYYDGQGKPLSMADIDRIDSISSLSWMQKRQILDSPDRPWHYESGLVLDGDWSARPLPFSSFNQEAKEKETVFTEYDSREKTILSDSFAHMARADHVQGFRDAVNRAADGVSVPRIGLVWERMREDPVLKDYFNPFWMVEVYADQVVDFRGKNTREKFWPFAWQQLLANQEYWRKLEEKQARYGRFALYKELGRIMTIARHQLTAKEFAEFYALEERVAGKSLMGMSEKDAKRAVQKRIDNALALVQKDIGAQVRSRFCADFVKPKPQKAKKAPPTSKNIHQ